MRLIGFVTLSTISAISAGEIQPKLEYTVHERYLKSLPSPFPALSEDERESRWGSEYAIGLHFADELDFYRAITAFKRAEILSPTLSQKRQCQYQILLNYYLGKRYIELERAYEASELKTVSSDFSPFQDLLLILFDTYYQLEEFQKAGHILSLIQTHAPKSYHPLLTYIALKEAKDSPILSTYREHKKSSLIAPLLNALLPGAGYFYLGQIQTSITALLVNGLFIAAAIFFFRRKAYAAAFIFLSFEAGWYFGGIQGGKGGAKLYNERVYEQIAIPYMNKEGIFPIYQLKHAF